MASIVRLAASITSDDLKDKQYDNHRNKAAPSLFSLRISCEGIPVNYDHREHSGDQTTN